MGAGDAAARPDRARHTSPGGGLEPELSSPERARAPGRRKPKGPRSARSLPPWLRVSSLVKGATRNVCSLCADTSRKERELSVRLGVQVVAQPAALSRDPGLRDHAGE